MHMYVCVYIYIYIYIISPPLIITPPNKNKPWGKIFVTINLDGGTITSLIKKKHIFWFDLPPS